MSKRVSPLFYICLAAVAIAGLIHLWIAPEHYSHTPAHGISFALMGALEVAWALAFWRRPSRWLYRAGLSLAGGLIVLWAFTWVLPVPFGYAPEPITASLLVCKLSELIGVMSLGLLALHGRVIWPTGASVPRVFNEIFALAFITGLVFYGIGEGADWFLPTWSLEEEQAHHEEAAVGLDAESRSRIAPTVLVTTPATAPGSNSLTSTGDAQTRARSTGVAAATSDQQTMFLIEGGILTPIRNGSRLVLSKGLEAEVFINPFPPALSNELELYLRRAGTGEPVNDAQVKLVFQMQYMEHGVWEDGAVDIGEGHYLAPLNFLMSGDWRVDISVRLPESVVSMTLVLAVYPQ